MVSSAGEMVNAGIKRVGRNKNLVRKAVPWDRKTPHLERRIAFWNGPERKLK
jgi:hypothetical protein